MSAASQIIAPAVSLSPDSDLTLITKFLASWRSLSLSSFSKSGYSIWLKARDNAFVLCVFHSCTRWLNSSYKKKRWKDIFTVVALTTFQLEVAYTRQLIQSQLNVLFHHKASSPYSGKNATKHEPVRHCHAGQDTDRSRSNNMVRTNNQNFNLLPSFCQLI